MSKLRNKITAIGEQMVKCNSVCDGVATRRPNEGILPRCLILEDAGRTDGVGAIVCGLNPGTGTRQNLKQQQEYYVAQGASYGSEVEFFWNQGQRDYVYYKKLRKLVNALGLAGPILWTDTVKCQKKDDKKSFNHSDFSATVRRCVGKYLHQEVEACPDKWIAIGVGRDAFAALRLVCLKHFVLGVPHCTGQFAAKTNFDELFDKDKLRPKFMKQFHDARNREPTGELWLTSKR